MVINLFFLKSIEKHCRDGHCRGIITLALDFPQPLESQIKDVESINKTEFEVLCPALRVQS